MPLAILSGQQYRCEMMAGYENRDERICKASARAWRYEPAIGNFRTLRSPIRRRDPSFRARQKLWHRFDGDNIISQRTIEGALFRAAHDVPGKPGIIVILDTVCKLCSDFS